MPRLYVLYHYYAPDDVVSARHFEDLCVGLQRRGFDVTVFPTLRSRHDANVTYPAAEARGGVQIRRIWRPDLRQGSLLGRLVNMLWMHAAWFFILLRLPRPDVVLVGTDPILTVALAPLFKVFWPRTQLAHWCFDLYPEAAIADGMIAESSLVARILKAVARRSYKACDVIVDLGPCMRRRIAAYGATKARVATVAPWALVEPNEVQIGDPELRREVFGDARLTLMYSGNFGRAHSFASTLMLAKILEPAGIRFCFAGRGYRLPELKHAITEDPNGSVKLTDLVPEARLAQHLAIADVHIVTLQDAWQGIVVPSKFFGALAAGRPVLFAGDRASAVAQWILAHDLGWVLEDAGIDAVAAALQCYASDPEQRRAMERRCFEVYHQYFAKERGLAQWSELLRSV